MPATDSQPRIINIYNFIREIEPRVAEDLRHELYETTVKEIELLKQYGLPGTYALQYDALMVERYQTLLKDRLDERDEIGAWWEIVQGQVEKAGIEWRGRYPWDWQAHVGFATGYTPLEREKLVDVYMADFKAIFGYYPRTVGSWIIDSHSLAYMHEKYGIVASCNCKDQIGTDGYTLHGGYWNQAYYPSLKNAYMPAQTPEQQIPVPIFRMLGSDPVDQYDRQIGEAEQDVLTLEPICTQDNARWINWFFDVNFNQPCLAFAYAQVGQENSFLWNAFDKGLTLQVQMVAELVRAGKVQVQTLEQSGRWFAEKFPVTPATCVVAPGDAANSGRQTVWYNSRFYRINFIWEHGGLRIRDLHLFDADYASSYLTQPLREPMAEYTTLPVMDGNTWSTAQEVAGMRLVHKVGESAVTVATTLTDVKEIETDKLLIACALEGGGTLEILCSESSIEISTSGLASAADYALLMTWSGEKPTTIESIESNTIHYRQKNFGYRLKVDCGRIEAVGAKFGDAGILLLPNAEGQLVLNCDTTFGQQFKN